MICPRCGLGVASPDDHRWASECVGALRDYGRRLEANLNDYTITLAGGPLARFEATTIEPMR